jgi:glycosyltransferase involved in cell wall biosynthesis/2-polyprenyl-3-methyl-5-hydroxy-6-metoxy-1,4-benzoquinol methylase
MAASFHFSALPAIIAAKKLNIPTIYEVRGFLDLLRNSKNKDSSIEKKYIRDFNLERRTAKIADHVITLNKYMKEKLITDGIESNKISIITNGCDFRKFKPQAKDLTIIKKLAINSKTIIIGYVGSLAFYEGIDDLVKVCGKLKKDKIDFKLLIVGSSVSHKLNGEDVAVTKIKQIAKENKIDEKLITTGRISSDEILKYYSLIDIMIYPRKALPICEIVLPTKVLESIALGKAIIVSSVNGLSEMITNNKTGLVFEKSNMNSLYLCLKKFVIDKKLRFHLGNNARQHNEKIRNWNLISLELIKIIKNISKYSLKYNYRKSKEINEIKIATQDKLVKKNINLNLFENYPEWWNFITDDFKQKSEYIDSNSWNLSKSCLELKNKYTNKFGYDRVGRRIPLKNWIRADIFSEIVKPNLELQDIGSGLGEFLNLLSLKNKKIEIDSIDLKDWDLWFDFDKRFNRYYKNIFDLDLNNKREITTCFEVIEHLPTHQIQNAVEILRGITKKKLFISVPFLEKLPLYKSHFTRFDEKKIIQLFPDGEYRIISQNPSNKKYVDAWILIEININ